MNWWKIEFLIFAWITSFFCPKHYAWLVDHFWEDFCVAWVCKTVFLLPSLSQKALVQSFQYNGSPDSRLPLFHDDFFLNFFPSRFHVYKWTPHEGPPFLNYQSCLIFKVVFKGGCHCILGHRFVLLMGIFQTLQELDFVHFKKNSIWRLAVNYVIWLAAWCV